MKHVRVLGFLFLAIVLLPGCKKVADEKSSPLEPGQIVFYSVPAVKNLTVEFSTSPTVPVDIYIVADKDAETAKTALQNGKEPSSPLATKKGDSSGSISASSTAKTEMTVLVTSNKKTTVNVKINGS